MTLQRLVLGGQDPDLGNLPEKCKSQILEEEPVSVSAASAVSMSPSFCLVSCESFLMKDQSDSTISQ